LTSTSTPDRDAARANAHRGTAFIEVYQNCKIFNERGLQYATDKSSKADTNLPGARQPLLFGKGPEQGIRLQGSIRRW